MVARSSCVGYVNTESVFSGFSLPEAHQEGRTPRNLRQRVHVRTSASKSNSGINRFQLDRILDQAEVIPGSDRILARSFVRAIPPTHTSSATDTPDTLDLPALPAARA